MPEELETPPEVKAVYDWDFFLSHPGTDLDAARNLYKELNPPAKVFLDDVCLRGAYDTELPKAQRSSLINVILITPNTKKAHYQRSEIAIAISMLRADPHTHRVIPIYLKENNKPFGLEIVQSFDVPENSDFTEIGQRLLERLEELKKLEVKKEQVVEQQQIAVAKITDNNSKAEVLAGIHEATKFVHPILFTLIGLFVLILGLLTVVLVILQPPITIAMTFGTLLGAFDSAILFFILRIVSRSLGDAGQIAQGRINGG